MIKLLGIMSISLFIQACTATPPPSTSGYVPRSSTMSTPSYSTDRIKQKREAEFAQKLIAIQQRNPVRDAHNLASQGNKYLWAYQSGRGGSTKAPGLTRQQLTNLRGCSLVQLKGMGDVIYGDNHLKYRVAARNYAKQFNLAILPYCR